MKTKKLTKMSRTMRKLRAVVTSIACWPLHPENAAAYDSFSVDLRFSTYDVLLIYCWVELSPVVTCRDTVYVCVCVLILSLY